MRKRTLVGSLLLLSSLWGSSMGLAASSNIQDAIIHDDILILNRIVGTNNQQNGQQNLTGQSVQQNNAILGLGGTFNVQINEALLRMSVENRIHGNQNIGNYQGTSSFVQFIQDNNLHDSDGRFQGNFAEVDIHEQNTISGSNHSSVTQSNSSQVSINQSQSVQ